MPHATESAALRAAFSQIKRRKTGTRYPKPLRLRAPQASRSRLRLDYVLLLPYLRALEALTQIVPPNQDKANPKGRAHGYQNKRPESSAQDQPNIARRMQ